MVKSALLTEPERLETPNVHPFTQHTFKNTWGVPRDPPKSWELLFLFSGAHEEGFHILRRAREQVDTGIQHGTSFPLLFKYHELTFTSRRYAVIVAHTLIQLISVLGTGMAS